MTRSPSAISFSRSFAQPFAIAFNSDVNPARPCRSSGGKYVPPKNGLSSGVSHALKGQPPCPVIACT
jgi:hypothetical protein